jgi:hypothetical protein
VALVFSQEGTSYHVRLLRRASLQGIFMTCTLKVSNKELFVLSGTGLFV